MIFQNTYIRFCAGYVKQGIKNFVLVPIAFVNEHIETLHEMDIEYCHDLGKKVRIKPQDLMNNFEYSSNLLHRIQGWNGAYAQSRGT